MNPRIVQSPKSKVQSLRPRSGWLDAPIRNEIRLRFVLGLAGPSGSGKSTAAGLLRSWGAWVLEGDDLGRRALADPVLAERVRNSLGMETLDRKALAKTVFGDREALRKLSSLTWPWIREEAGKVLRSKREGLLVFDAAVLLEAGWGFLCDRVLVLDSPEALRFTRLRSAGLSEGQARSRIQAQAGLGRKPGAAEVWANMGTKAELAESLMRFLLRNASPVLGGG